ncbi:hypothetical protein GRS48_05480 [Halorubrum sp. JWXQ-INN 858]|uniref:hypothetical protein n=1 Tax=Halorubrum sp. JWXQ-INN 858 TaxID=2690782 RepID=UPI00135B82EC|nr:hypothetical protein [Halorubrum sp. JWXQ-INN 858]MWV64277.1 hypothetical protein [Halorubrum sp. JWXQ-INN 858]
MKQEEDLEEVGEHVGRTVLSKQIDSYYNVQQGARQIFGLGISVAGLTASIAATGLIGLSLDGEISEPVLVESSFDSLKLIFILILILSLIVSLAHIAICTSQLFQLIWPKRLRPLTNNDGDISKFKIVAKEQAEPLSEIINSNSEALAELYSTQKDSYYNILGIIFAIFNMAIILAGIGQGDVTLLVYISLLILLALLLAFILFLKQLAIFSYIRISRMYSNWSGVKTEVTNIIRVIMKPSDPFTPIIMLLIHFLSDLFEYMSTFHNKYAIAPFPYSLMLSFFWLVIVLFYTYSGFLIFTDSLWPIISDRLSAWKIR